MVEGVVKTKDKKEEWEDEKNKKEEDLTTDCKN